jgi:hypothetical protein
MNRTERKKYSQEYTRINRRYEVKYFPKVQKDIKAKVSSLINVIKERGIPAAQVELSVDLVNSSLSKTVRALYLEVGLRHARKEYRRQREEIKAAPKKKHYHRTNKARVSTLNLSTKGFGFNAEWTAFILNYLEAFLSDEVLFKVNATTRRKLQDVLGESITEGWTIEKTVEKLESLPFTKIQAARIVRTETTRAANVGTMAAVDTSEYEQVKEWIAARDMRTRGFNPKDHADHWNLDGKVVDVGEKFTDEKSEAQLSFPGDPDVGPENTVNCRCSIAIVAKRDENGMLVPKAQPAVYAPVLGLLRPPIAASPNLGLRVINK